jgi:CheY-like chemotaxis protein
VSKATKNPVSLEGITLLNKPLVLVVDDDPVHHKLFSLIADRLDITAHLVFSSSQALAAINSRPFDLILMDCRMPEEDGFSCCSRIRNMSSPAKDIPIIAVTACVLPGDKEKCLEVGMNDFLGKPFTLDQLHTIIFHWLPAHKQT